MKTIIIQQNDAGQRLDRFLSKAFPALSHGIIRAGLRKNKIKVNGRRPEAAQYLEFQDTVRLFFDDGILSGKKTKINNTSKKNSEKPALNIIYEDANILLLDKQVGLAVHEDNNNEPDTLISRVKDYLIQKGEFFPGNELSFSPALCNRIDRNTGGLVIAAKNAAALRIMSEKIKNRELKKLYLCLVYGVPKPRDAILTAFLKKLSKENRVIVSSVQKTRDYKKIETAYRVLRDDGETALLEIDLITGRTHQIRAQMAFAGYPLVGDTKYGKYRQDEKFLKFKSQALYSYKLKFGFKKDAGELEYLNGREFETDPKNIWFLNM